jgi:hypothetical protein
MRNNPPHARIDDKRPTSVMGDIKSSATAYQDETPFGGGTEVANRGAAIERKARSIG